jgi:hypothetical protein
MSTTTSVTPGKIGEALRFNSSTAQDVSIGTAPASLVFAYNQPFSISLWAKPAATVGSGIFDRLVTIAASSGNFEYFIMANNSSFSFNLGKNGTGDNSVTGSTFTVGKWYHLVGVYNGSTMNFYINGTSVGTAAYTFGALSSPNGLFSIGGAGSSSNTFNGSIDDVRVYNTALSAQQIAQLYALGTATIGHSTPTVNGLLGYWTFDGPTLHWSTGKIDDASGQGNTGQMIGMSTTTSVTPGKIGQALKFNGVNSYISEPTSISGIETVAFWAKASTTLAVAQGLINLTGSSVYISTNSSKVLSATGFTSPTYYIDGIASSTPGLYDAKWHQVIVTGTAAITGSQVQIGLANGVYFGGAIDDVRLYNTVLNYQQVWQLYKTGAVRI